MGFRNILITASYSHYSHCAARIWLDCINLIQLDLNSHVQFGCIVPKKAQIILCKTCPDLIWMAWSGFGLTHLAQKQVGVQESSRQVLAECDWPTTSFPLSGLVAFFHKQPGSYHAKPTWIQFGVSGQVLAKWIRSRSKLVCKKHQACFWPMLLIWVGCELDLACSLGMPACPGLICFFKIRPVLKGCILQKKPVFVVCVSLFYVCV